ncbi:pheophytinase, chloroplastic-like [Impatiens glandulifera]|uniref:pheophytinase, chloroplastic-like n=1 Tax=Impatiens glandulifera TaxID=253017 RepID=UPI001FB17FF1|nr:pheophytinase, chloroplastic-like [Impatiens glandulifera]
MDIISSSAPCCYTIPRLTVTTNSKWISSRKTELRVICGYKSYAADDRKSLSSTVAGNEEKTIAKMLIPGLPTESGGESEVSISSGFWEWKPKFTVHYEAAGSKNVNSPPILFLPGFGVGSFHYEKQLKDLGRDYRVWSIDFLGQGKSLPLEDPTSQTREGQSSSMWGFGDHAEPWANDLVYSIDLWRDQVQYFIEEVIKEPVYIVGNSLGGYVALYLAACNPELVKGVTLLNATPFWGFLPNPTRSPSLARLFPWAGTFPLPDSIRKLTEIIWMKISDPESIAEILRQVYADHSTNVDKVFSHILEITEHPAAAASFASIMCAPQGQMSFKDSLSRCGINNIPICLVYGKEDPWVNPFWGIQVKKQLQEAPYYEISPAGHCPHDEVPEVVNYLLRGWIKSVESRFCVKFPLLEEAQNDEYGVAREMEFVREGSRKSVRVQFVGGNDISLWRRISSYIYSKFSHVVTLGKSV